MNQIFSQITSSTYTKPELIRRLRLVRDFVSFRLFDSSLPGQSANLETAIDTFLVNYKASTLLAESIRRDSEWLKSLGDGFFQQFTPANTDSLFRQFEQELANLQLVILYLPIELPEKNLEQVGSWFKDNISRDSIFETRFDADLIAGCALSIGGVYKDYSIRARINQNKAAILQNLASFKKS